MPSFLSTLINADEPQFSIGVYELEAMTGKKGIDVAYWADILSRAHALMRNLKLDTANTSAIELYNTLRANISDEGLFHNMDDVGLIIGKNQVVSFNIDDLRSNAGKSINEATCVGMKQNIYLGIIHRYNIASHDNPRVMEIAEHAGFYVNLPSNQNLEVNIIEVKGENMVNILCVGDIISDAFIKLSEEHAEHYTDDKGYQRISLELGAKIPYDNVDLVTAVECSPNAAVSLSRLGLNASLMSWIGDDAVGKEMVEYLNKQGVGTQDMVVESGMKSNFHYVLRYGADRIKLQKFEDYSYQWHTPETKPDWLYLGVLGEKTWPLHESMLNYLNENPDIKLVFQPGMYHLMWGTEKMAPFYHRAEIVIMNREEAAQVTGRERTDMHGLMNGLHELGATVVVVTDGPDGAYASDGQKRLFMRNYPDPQPPLDRTGAGDAFASTIASALALGHSLEDALKWAPINSMSVVQQMGAQAGLLNQEKLAEYLSNAPEGYYPTEYN